MKMPWHKRAVRDDDLDAEIRSHFAMAVADRRRAAAGSVRCW
jgi:hypothetical protein